MPTLAEILLNETQRPLVVADCVQLIEEEVQSKRGISGLAIKAAFKTVKTFKSGIIQGSVEALVDDFVAQMEEFYAGFQERGGGEIAPAVIKAKDPIAESLLAITDQRADRNRHKILVSAYRKLRPMGKKQVMAAMPRVGAMLKKNGA